MDQKIKKLRVSIDRGLKAMNTLQTVDDNRVYLDRAHYSLDLGKMWLGMVLKEMEVENPYPDSMDASNEKIAPTADVSEDESPFFMAGDTPIQRVKKLRQASQDFVDEFWDEIKTSDLKWSYKANIALTNAYTNLVNCKLWLGMELGRIRDLQMNSEDGVA